MYIAPIVYYVYVKALIMDHTVLPANTPCLSFLRKRLPDDVTLN